MKRNKAAGIDGIRNKAWMVGGEKVGRKLWEVVRKIWEGRDSRMNGG